MRQFKAALPKDRSFTESEIGGELSTIFLLQERLPAHAIQPGQSRFKPLGKITVTQAIIIAETSHTIDEMQERIRLLLLEGKDTTQFRGQAPAANLYTEDQVQDIVRRAVIELQKQQAGALPKTEPEDLAEIVVNPPPPEHTGIQMKPRKSVKEYQAERQAEIDRYTKKAAIIGMRPPELRRDGKIDGRWLRRFQRDWAAHLDNHPEAASV